MNQLTPFGIRGDGSIQPGDSIGISPYTGFNVLISAPGVSQKSVAHYLNLLADLHVRNGGNRAIAETALHRVIELFPNSAVAANAEKRIAYLETELRRNQKSQVVQLGSYEDNLG